MLSPAIHLRVIGAPLVTPIAIAAMAIAGPRTGALAIGLPLITPVMAVVVVAVPMVVVVP